MRRALQFEDRPYEAASSDRNGGSRAGSVWSDPNFLWARWRAWERMTLSFLAWRKNQNGELAYRIGAPSVVEFRGHGKLPDSSLRDRKSTRLNSSHVRISY